MKLKLQKSTDTNTNTNVKIKTDIKPAPKLKSDSESKSELKADSEPIKSNINENNNLKLFPLFDGKKSIKDWIALAYQWLINNHFIDFAHELQSEVYKSLLNKNPTKALNYALAFIKAPNYDNIAKQFNTTKTLIIRNIDKLQDTHPAIYLALGYKSKNSQGKDKRVINKLQEKKIINIPAEL